jgi:hypothetical protein
VEITHAGSDSEMVAHPALARSSDGSIVLVFTRYDPAARGPQLQAVQLTLSGNGTDLLPGLIQAVGGGEGGTLVAADPLGPTFLLAFVQQGDIMIAPLDDIGMSQGTNALGLRTSSLRPALAIQSNLLALAWDQPGGLPGTATAQLAQITGGTATMVTVSGIHPWLASVPGQPDQVLLLGVGDGQVTVDRYDATGNRRGMRTVGGPGADVRLATSIARVVDSPAGAVAVASWDPDSQTSTTYLDLGGSDGGAAMTPVTETLTDRQLVGLGAAYDPASGFVLAALRGVKLDGSGSPLTLHAISPISYGMAELDGDPGATPTGLPEADPAVVATAQGGFVVAWGEQGAGTSRLQAATVTCFTLHTD